MTTEWIDKPDGDGLWWWDVNGNIELHAIHDGTRRTIMHGDGDVCFGTAHKSPFTLGKWKRAEITKPDRYVAPKPPKVEQYTAKFEGHAPRFITKIVDQYVATNHDGTVTNWGSWGYAKTSYTDIKPIEAS